MRRKFQDHANQSNILLAKLMTGIMLGDPVSKTKYLDTSFSQSGKPIMEYDNRKLGNA